MAPPPFGRERVEGAANRLFVPSLRAVPVFSAMDYQTPPGMLFRDREVFFGTWADDRGVAMSVWPIHGYKHPRSSGDRRAPGR
jgi:hypothetical protein